LEQVTREGGVGGWREQREMSCSNYLLVSKERGINMIKWLSKREAATAPGRGLEDKSDVIRSVVHGGREVCGDGHKHYM
jgi:hypothetical protein